jgi:tRNA (mo5U34)-methyltransferase
MAESLDDLRRELIELGPWHLDVEITPELSTRAWRESGEPYPESLGAVVFLDNREPFQEKLLTAYPGGLAGRSVLDCACNCGGYLFWAKEIGAGECFGFDVRDHWIRQANFLLEHRQGPTEDVRFAVRDLYELPALGLEPFDVTLFQGILYHLPDPVRGLKIAADLTSELMIVNTGTKAGLPDGLLAVDRESREQVMSGVHGLNWYPTGPEVVSRMLGWVGFAETRLLWWREEIRPGRGRLEIAASKKPGLLDRLAARTPTDARAEPSVATE